FFLRAMSRGLEHLAAHALTEHFGDHDRTILLLVVFENRNQGSPHRKAGAIEGVHELGLGAWFRTIADVGASRLESFEVAAAADLSIGVLAGQPDLEVEAAGGGEADVARAQRHDAEGQLELAEDFAGVGHEPVELLVGVGGSGELDELDLVELVLSDESAGVAPVAAGLEPETGCVCAESGGELLCVEDLVTEEVG